MQVPGLYCSCCKGFQSNPNTGKNIQTESYNGKMDGIGLVLFCSYPPLKALYSTVDIHPFTHTFIQCWKCCASSITHRRLSRQGQFGVRYFAQGHFCMRTGKARYQTMTFLLVDSPLFLQQPKRVSCGFSTFSRHTSESQRMLLIALMVLKQFNVLKYFSSVHI